MFMTPFIYTQMFISEVTEYFPVLKTPSQVALINLELEYFVGIIVF